MEENIEETVLEQIQEQELQGRIYELAYLFVPTYDIDGSLVRFSELKEYLQAKGAECISEDAPKLIELEYEMSITIKNKKTWFDEAYFGWIKFALEPELITAIHDELERDETLLRFMIIKTVRENTISSKRTFAPRVRKDTSVEIDESLSQGEEIKEVATDIEVDQAVESLVTEA